MTNGFLENRILILLMTGCIFLTVFTMVCAAGYLITKRRQKVDARFQKYFVDEQRSIYYTRQKKLKNDKKLNIRIKVPDTIRTQLAIAGVMMRPEEFLILWILLSVGPAILSAILFGSMINSLAFILIGIIIPPYLVARKKKKRIIAFEEQLSEALSVISNCLRSGLTFQKALENISNEMPAPISKEFALVLREIRFGATLEKALSNMVQRIKSPDLDMVVSAVLIQRQVGGNLSEILESISETIKGRIRLKADIRVLTATGQMSEIVISALPAAIGLILMITNPEYIMAFFNTEIGIFMLCVAAVMELIGILIIKRIIDIKY